MRSVFVVGAPSGTGKTTLLKRLLAARPDLRFSVSHTTRPPRPGEVAGRDYHFVPRAEFERRAAAGEFLEWAEVYGHLYGTHRDELERAQKDDVDLVLDVDVQGARAVRAALPQATLILILPPSWAAMEARLRARGTDSDETIRRRLALARTQLEGYPVYHHAIINDDVEQAYALLEAIVLAARQRLELQEGHVRRLLAATPEPAPAAGSGPPAVEGGA